MKIRTWLFFWLVGFTIVNYANAGSDVAKLDRQLCSICHGSGGSIGSDLFPHLAAMPAAYFTNQMKAFRDKTRADENAQRFMWGISSRLTDESIEQLAAFYESQPPVHEGKVTDQSQYDAGKNVFLNGHAEKGVPPCMACHGEKGEGKESTPRLGGQSEAYLKRQLKVFYGNERPAATAMHEVVKGLNEHDIEAIAQYLQAQ